MKLTNNSRYLGLPYVFQACSKHQNNASGKARKTAPA